MTEKRYYCKDYEESYYVFDSKTLSESEFEENVEYYGYNVFADSLTGEEVVDLLNENEQLKKDCTVLIYHNQEYRKENEQLKADKQSLIDFIRNEFPKSYKHILEGFE